MNLKIPQGIANGIEDGDLEFDREFMDWRVLRGHCLTQPVVEEIVDLGDRYGMRFSIVAEGLGVMVVMHELPRTPKKPERRRDMRRGLLVL